MSDDAASAVVVVEEEGAGAVCAGNLVDEEKRIPATTEASNEIVEQQPAANDGEVDLEEGEIGDDDENNNTNNNSTDKDTSRKANKKKHKHRKRRKKHSQSRDKKLKTEEGEAEEEGATALLLTNNNENGFVEQDSDEDSTEGEDEGGDDDDEDGDDTNDSGSLTSTAPAKSLFDLFGNQVNNGYVDPTITEKENSKPAKLEELLEKRRKKKTTKAKRLELKRQLLESEEFKKKQEKKQEKNRRYFEQVKRQEERKIKLNETICKFYLEGRCTKGDECQFSHNATVNKKPEVCKYYLQGYCSKNQNCTYMHSEFPCKFYHTNKECLNGANCRFSHAPLTQEMHDAFDKYLKETDESTGKKPSLLGSPPRYDKSAPVRVGLLPVPGIPSLVSKSIPSLLSVQPNQQQQASSIPSLMALPIGPKAPSNASIPSIMSNLNDLKPSPLLLAQPMPKPSSFFCQDVDERVVPAVAAAPAPVLSPAHQATDVDERDIVIPKAFEASAAAAIDTNDLLAKLLIQQQQQNQSLVTDLLSTLAGPLAAPQPTVSLINSFLKQIKPEQPTDYDNHYENGYSKGLTIVDDDDDDESSIEIDARTDGTLPYNINLIDVQPSSLWSNPPVASSSTKTEGDAVLDPRIEFYSNKANNKYLNENNLKPEPQQQQLPNIHSNNIIQSSASSPPQQQTQTTSIPEYRDPRRLASSKPSINSLMNETALPEIKFPAANQQKSQPQQHVQQTQTQQQQKNNTDGVVKLSIADYKRKLQKPINTSEEAFNNKRLPFQSYAPQQQQQQPQQQASYAPQIPSYSVTNQITNSLSDIGPPQSLHELLKNYPSS